jgi:hypothetical protein
LPRRAIGWLGQLVQSQSAILSYIDVFWIFAIVAALMVPVALLLLRAIELRPGPRCPLMHAQCTAPNA